MLGSKKWLNQLDWFSASVWFMKNHFFTIFGLGLVAALGRATQLGAFGLITPASHLLLEVIVESVRVLIFVYALGFTNVRAGASRIVAVFTNRSSRRKNCTIARQAFKKQRVALVVNLAVFLLFAWGINRLIDYAAYQTCLYAKLKASQIISDQSSEWTLILFFKNISVIPFTLVFNALFLLWITNRLTRTLTYTQKNQ